MTTQKVKTHVGENHFSIIQRKSKMKETAEKIFKNCRTIVNSHKEQKIEVSMRQMRILKIILCHDYTQDMLARIFCDAIKLQILNETNILRKRVYLMPKESIFLQIPLPKYGEHEFAAYCEDPEENKLNPKTLFYNPEDNKISNFWRLPSFKEVL